MIEVFTCDRCCRVIAIDEPHLSDVPRMNSRVEAGKSCSSSSNMEQDGRRNLVRLARAALRWRELDVEDRCRTDPLYWLTHYIRTRDDDWREKGAEPYTRFRD